MIVEFASMKATSRVPQICLRNGSYMTTRSIITSSRLQAMPLTSLSNPIAGQHSQTKLAEATLKRFWKAVDIESSDAGFHVTLDSRPLKTPSSNTITIPSNRFILATLIAAEWSQVSSASIRQHQLPLTSLAARAIDHLDNHHKDRYTTIASLLRYLDTDAVLIHSPGDNKLTRMQEAEWTPIRRWAEAFFGVQISYLSGDALVPNKQSPTTKKAVEIWLRELDKWELAAFERSVYTTKSFLLSTILVVSQHSGHTDIESTRKSSNQMGPGKGERVAVKSVEDIARLATLEVRYQTANWGEVEDTHDVDHEDIRRQLGSACIVLARS